MTSSNVDTGKAFAGMFVRSAVLASFPENPPKMATGRGV